MAIRPYRVLIMTMWFINLKSAVYCNYIFEFAQDLRMRHEKLGFKIASLSVDRDENTLQVRKSYWYHMQKFSSVTAFAVDAHSENIVEGISETKHLILPENYGACIYQLLVEVGFIYPYQ